MTMDNAKSQEIAKAAIQLEKLAIAYQEATEEDEKTRIAEFFSKVDAKYKSLIAPFLR